MQLGDEPRVALRATIPRISARSSSNLPSHRMPAATLPISCLYGAPTAGNVVHASANASNSQAHGRKEDRLKAANISEEAQDAANHLCFGC